MRLGFLLLLMLLLGVVSANGQSMDIADDDYFADTDYIQMEFGLDSISEAGVYSFSCMIYNTREARKTIVLRLDTAYQNTLYVCGQVQAPFLTRRKYMFYALELPQGQGTPMRVTTGKDINEQQGIRFFDHPTTFFPFVIGLGADNWWAIFTGLGFLLFIWISALVQGFSYLLSKRKVHAYYSVYLVLLGLFFYQSMITNNVIRDLDGLWPERGLLLKILLQPAFHIAYVLFIRVFLQTKTKYQHFERVARWYILLAAISIPVLYMLYSYDNGLAYAYFDIYRLAVVAISIYLIIYIARQKDPLSKFIVWGSVAFVGFATLAMLLTWMDIYLEHYGTLYLTLLGGVIEVSLFSLGITEKTNILSKEKLRLETAYTQQLEANARILEKGKRDLTDSVASLRRELEEEQAASIAAIVSNKDLEQEVAQLRMRLNPHFVFNALTSLKSFVLNKQIAEAAGHIDELAIFMRNVLLEAPKQTISLGLMLNHIRNYVAIENKRLENPVRLEVSVDPLINLSAEEVPSMILQPFVENAIWHGLASSTREPRRLSVAATDMEDHLQIIVEDNGVGRKISERSRSDAHHNGVAITILAKRIGLYNEGTPGLQIVDLHDGDGRPAGTRVIIKLLREL